MKLILQESEMMDDIIQKVVEYFGTLEEPYYGPSFILPDGKFLDLTKSDIRNGHSEVERYLFEQGIIKEYVARNGCPYIQEQGCIRIDYEKYYIELPPGNITRGQYDSLLVWLDFLSHSVIKVGISPYRDTEVEYFFKETIPDDVVKQIRKYYMYGVLRENLKEDK